MMTMIVMMMIVMVMMLMVMDQNIIYCLFYFYPTISTIDIYYDDDRKKEF